MEESKALERLLISKEETARRIQEMASKAEKIFLIEKETGRIVFKDYTALPDIWKVGALLCGKHFAKELKIKDVKDALGVTEIAKELHRPATALSGPLSDLVKRGWVEKDPHRKYKVIYYHIDDILNECIKALSKRKST
jgi:hypothetical protein